MAKLPLEGIRVVDMTLVWAGPYGAMHLGDLGAEVIRVEPLTYIPSSIRGSQARYPKEAEALLPYGMSTFPQRDPGVRPWNRIATANAHLRNKYSISLDVRRPEGKDIFRRLIEISDVFIENNVTGAMKRLGFTYDALSQWNPRLIMVSSSGMGQTGPWATYRGHGLHFEAAYGHYTMCGYPDMDPSGAPSGVVADAASGVTIAFITMAALHHRNKTGKGQYIDLSQGENVINHWGEIFMDYTMNGRSAGPMGNRDPSMVQGVYPCLGDDEWVAISIETDVQWQALCRVIGQPELADDERFADAVSRYRNHDEVDQLIEAWTKDRGPYQAFHLLQEAGIPAGPMMHEALAYSDPHLRERNFFVSVTHPETGPVVDGQATPGTHLYPGTTYKFSKTPVTVRKPPVCLGEDNEYIYKEVLKVSEEEYQQLIAEGHIGMDYAPDVP